ncbi:MAG: hypothetical protein ACK6AD_04290 [Cyanobacteriota bacterium]|jgi:hypothetical protein
MATRITGRRCALGLSLLLLASGTAFADSMAGRISANLGPHAPSPGPPSPSPQPGRSAGRVPKADRTARFPLRREGGGTRGACASRLVAHLVPETGQLDPGTAALIGLIEGETPEPVALVLRLPGRDWLLAPRRMASLRLFRLPQPLEEGLWESFPACDGPTEPQAPPARSLLLGPGERSVDPLSQAALLRLWRSCGATLPTEAVISGWSYGHLLDRLPQHLAVVCEALSQSAPSGP